MSKGYVMIAMGNDYVTQAYICAKSINATQTINNVSLVTSDIVPDEYKSVFDNIIEVPWHDKNSRSFYKTEHRWKVFHLTPYEETVVLDTDMIFLSDVSHWWNQLSSFDVCFPTSARTYRNTIVSSDYYRKAFTENNLPNVYCAFHYFKKSNTALEYYKKLEAVCTNWKDYYDSYVSKKTPALSSMDLNHAIALCDNNIENYALGNNLFNFVHMKSWVQDWEVNNDNWISTIPFYFTDTLQLKIGNFLQHGVFHYTEHKFCETVMEKY